MDEHQKGEQAARSFSVRTDCKPRPHTLAQDFHPQFEEDTTTPKTKEQMEPEICALYTTASKEQDNQLHPQF